MYGKHGAMKVPTSHSRKAKNRKSKLLIISVVILILALISTVTIAFIVDRTEPVVNTFNYATVSCKVNEESFDGKVKNNVTIENNGEVESYIRAKVVVTWMSEDGTKVTAAKPQVNTDYTITYTDNAAWKLGSDGYWYYTLPVNVGDATATLINSCSLANGAVVPNGFYLSVEVVGSAIQSTPTNAVTEKWSGGVSGVSDGSLVIKQGGAE